MLPWRVALQPGRNTTAVLIAVLVALAYYGSARLGYAFSIPLGIVTLWPPSGVTLAVLILSERRHWPAILVGALLGSFSSDLRSGYAAPVALAAAGANVGESLLAAWFLTSRLGPGFALSGVRSVFAFVGGAVIGTNAISSILGATVLRLGFNMSWGTGWLVWFVGDGLGMLIVAPVILAWMQAPVLPKMRTRAGAMEAALLAVILVGTSQVALGPVTNAALQPGPYAAFLPLLWAALRFGRAGAATSSLVVCAIAVWNAAAGAGPFASTTETTVNAALQVYAYMAVVGLSAMIPAAIIEEREAAERALYAAEERMRFAMEASGVGVWEVEFSSGETRWSATLERLHGMEAGAFGGTFRAFLDRVHPDDRAQVQKQVDEVTPEHTSSSILYRTVWPDGSVHWISSVGRTFYDAEGKPVRAGGVGMDVTERRRLEEQYRQSQKMEAVGQLAGGIAHDFNNLLTAIQGYGSLLADKLDPKSRQQADVAEILRAAQRAASLTQQLLAFSRQQVLAPRVTSLAQSLEGMAPMLRRLIGEHIEVSVRAPARPGSVMADPGQMEQVILNLALNARDAMPDGGTLLLEVVNADVGEAYEQRHIDVPAGRYVMLAVTDSGMGMDAATAARVFEPFFTTKAQGKGTGLGLSTVYGIVKQSGGSIFVYSEPGHGTTFKVYLPRVDDAPQRATPAEALAQGPAWETVLVTEDDEALRKLARLILESRGYRVLVAGTPQEAITVATNHREPIHLLLTDVVLPGMSGRVLAERLQPIKPAMKVLYMSGYTDDAVVHRGVLERETHFIQKPFGRDALLLKVRQALDVAPGNA